MDSRWLHTFRLRLADPSSQLQLAVLGVLSGFSCAVVVLCFRFLIDYPASLWMPDGLPDNFEALPLWAKLGLPLAGALVIGLVMSRMAVADTRVGIAHVITRLHAGHGHLQVKNAVLQFFGGAFAIITGQSGGREGPAIHLGAAVSSIIGQRLQLPNNSIRLLVGCGTAASIAASFNTPIAGVIFAMEVVMLEYTVSGFIPIMLAAITGTIMTRAVYGTDSLFLIPSIHMTSLWEVPYIAFLGLVAGCFGALFLVILKVGLHFSDKPAWLRCSAAGLVTGCLALVVPQVMGIGYDSLNAALADQLPLLLLAGLIVAKIVATALSAGLGLPIGLIGPNLLIGACLGSAMGGLGSLAFPELASGHSFYVLLGMGAMMGAVLNAPLAALMALLELSNNTAMIFPGMLAITVATLTTREVFHQHSAHQTVLDHLKQLLPTDPVSLALQRTGVGSMMQRSVASTHARISPDEVRTLLADNRRWYVIDPGDNARLQLINREELHPKMEAALVDAGEHPIDLLELAENSQTIAELHIRATLREALNLMDINKVDALYISGYLYGTELDKGVVTREDIERYTSTPQTS